MNKYEMSEAQASAVVATKIAEAEALLQEALEIATYHDLPVEYSFSADFSGWESSNAWEQSNC